MKTVGVLVCLLSLSSSGGRLVAQDSSLRAERVVEYRIGHAADLSAKVGPVRIHSVEFSDLGRNYGQGGLAARLRSGANPSEASTTIRSHFIVENPSGDAWQVTFTLEFLDSGGAVIDKATKKSTWEGETKPLDFDHPLLSYVLPLIVNVRVKMEAKLD